MGFWPYFLHAHESEGGVLFSPFSLDPSVSLIGICTTLFCMARLLLLAEEVGEVTKPLMLNAVEEGGESAMFS